MIHELPILFSPLMIEAILKGEKSITSRIIREQPDDDGLWNHDRHPMSVDSDMSGWWGTVDETGDKKEYRCPYGYGGKPYLHNDILYVREAWNTLEEYTKKPDYSVMGIEDFVYRSGDCRIDKWKPSIHMPKQASRIWIEHKLMLVQRVSDILLHDAISEGIYKEWDGHHHWFRNYLTGDLIKSDPKKSFGTLWQTIHGRPKPIMINKKEILHYVVYPFDIEYAKEWEGVKQYKGKPLKVIPDPWVWRLHFDVLSTTGKINIKNGRH